jgi:hypothetical protein
MISVSWVYFNYQTLNCCPDHAFFLQLEFHWKMFCILEAQTLLLRFILRDNNDLITHEVMSALKNIYDIDAGKFPFVVLSSD